MFNLHLITVGKLKESYWADAETEYLKRLKPYVKITFTELKEESFRESDDRDKIKELEAKKILSQIPDNSVVIALHEYGKEYTSPMFANFLEKQSEQGQTITFIIGGPLGLHTSILEKAHHQLSLSQFTFPHQMVRTILLEQLYRAVTILKGKMYHY